MKTNDKEITTQKKPQSKGAKIALKVLNVVINILIVMVLIVSILIAVMALTSRANGISTIFGYTVQPIQSDSMKGKSPEGYPGGNFESGDLMLAKPTGYDEKATYELGDIVTYRTSDDSGNIMLIVHRIVDVVKDDSGNLRYQTQGDNRETSPVPDQIEKVNYLFAADIGSVYYSSDYEGKILKGWGKLLDFLQSQQGFFFVVLLPMIIFFLYELVRVVLNFSNYKKAQAEEEKEEAVKAAVAAAKTSGSIGDIPDSISEMTPEQLEQFKKFMEQQKAQNEPAAAPDSPENSDN